MDKEDALEQAYWNMDNLRAQGVPEREAFKRATRPVAIPIDTPHTFIFDTIDSYPVCCQKCRHFDYDSKHNEHHCGIHVMIPTRKHECRRQQLKGTQK